MLVSIVLKFVKLLINTKRLTVANFYAQILRDEINQVQAKNVSYESL